MKAVILAAGEGTRLRPFTATEPKVMLPVANKPILEFVVESLVDNGITDIVMVVGYQRERMMSYFGSGDEFGCDIEYVTQWKQLGTAHALSKVEGMIEDDFLLLPGDNVTSKETVADLLSQSDRYTVLATRSDTPSKYGVLTLKNGNVQGVVEKPEKSPSHLISTGIYSLPPEIFDYVDEVMDRQVYDMTSVVQEVIKDEEMNGVTSDSTWIDVVYPWDLISVNSIAMSGVEKVTNGTIEDGAMIQGPVKIGEGAVIRGGSYIKGPAIIGEGCEIGPHACVLPSTSIGPDTKISPFTMVKNSLLMDMVEVGPNSTVENSVLADGVKVGSGFSTFVDDARLETDEGLRLVEDIGGMIAEDTRIGSGVVVEAGVTIGDDCRIESGKTVREDIEPESRVV